MCGVGCVRLLPSCCTLLLCSQNQETKGHAIPKETEASDYRPGGWGRLGNGLMFRFWKKGNQRSPRWLQGATEGLEAMVDVMSACCGTLDIGHNLSFPIQRDLTPRVVVRRT